MLEGAGQEEIGDAHAFPLALASEGEEVRITSVRAGKGLTHKLAALGLPIGSQLRVHQRRPGGAMVVGRDNLRVALGAGMSYKVMVVLLPPSDLAHGAS